MPYAVLSRDSYQVPPILVRPIARDDREPIRRWRNDQITVLRQKTPISPDEQDNYFDRVVLPDFTADRPENILFAIDEAGELIGYGGLVHIAWTDRRAEVSFLLKTGLAGSEAETSIYLPAFHAAMRQVAFDDLKLVKLTFETFETRRSFLPAYEAMGYRRAGCWQSHVFHDGRFWDAHLHECLCPGIKA